MLRILLTLLAVLPVGAGAQQRNLVVAGEQRVALVIGNATYKESPLRNPVNDARAMEARLKQLGFIVVKRENMTARQIGPALREFKSRLTPGSTALFFYAGHGLQVKGTNYLPAVDADIDAEEDVPRFSLNVNEVLDLMDEAKSRVNLVFLDACRNNPFARKFRSQSRGLAQINTSASGTLISFATRPGSVAADGEGVNGLYTEHLLKHMEVPGLPIEQVLKRVGSGVKLASKGRQEPWMEGSIEGDFFFRAGVQAAAVATPSTPPAVAPSTTPDAVSIEIDYWNSVKDSKNPDELRAYLQEYPKGRYAALARARLKALTPAPVAAAPAVAPTPPKKAAVVQMASPPAPVVTPPPPQPVAPVAAYSAPPPPRPTASVSGPRVALLIGNADYGRKDTLPPLKNPANDATDLSEALKRYGFGSVAVTLNADYRTMRSAISKFGEDLRMAGPRAVGFFYYAGHAVEHRGTNYLIPLGTRISRPQELEFDTIDAQRPLAYMEEAGNAVNIMLLDASRANPFPQLEGRGGLAQLRAPTDHFIGYSAAPGQIASDSEGRNSLFTQQLLESLRQPNSEIDAVFTRLTAVIANRTARQQVPWKFSGLKVDFRFNPNE